MSAALARGTRASPSEKQPKEARFIVTSLYVACGIHGATASDNDATSNIIVSHSGGIYLPANDAIRPHE